MTANVDKSVTFQSDEQQLMDVDASWTPQELLEKENIFFLKDLNKVLDIDTTKVKKVARELKSKGGSTWDTMGIRKIWNHWMVRMTVFAPYFRENLISKVRTVKKNWDGNQLLQQKGLFLLTDVCKLIPFTSYQLRYQAKKNPNSREEFGVWKDKEMKTYLVDMEIFAEWVNTLWEREN